MGGKLLLKLSIQIIDSDYYVSIIKENYKDMKSLRMKVWVLQFGNDLKHKSTWMKDYLKKKNVKTID